MDRSEELKPGIAHLTSCNHHQYLLDPVHSSPGRAAELRKYLLSWHNGDGWYDVLTYPNQAAPGSAVSNSGR